jgi:hypothetical protein
MRGGGGGIDREFFREIWGTSRGWLIDGHLIATKRIRLIVGASRKVAHKRLSFMCRKVLRRDETHPQTTSFGLGRWLTLSGHTCRSLQFF